MIYGNICGSYLKKILSNSNDGKQEEIAKDLLQNGISRRQLTVRKFLQGKEKLKDCFREVDLCIMPSRTEGFGLTALEALSAGLPILVSGNSGFGDALRTVPFGTSFVVDSEDPKVWAEAIDGVRKKNRSQRLKGIEQLRTSYEEKFSWEKQCDSLVDKMWEKVYGTGMLMIFIFLSVDSSLVVVFQIYSVIDVNTSCTLK